MKLSYLGLDTSERRLSKLALSVTDKDVIWRRRRIKRKIKAMTNIICLPYWRKEDVQISRHWRAVGQKRFVTLKCCSAEYWRRLGPLNWKLIQRLIRNVQRRVVVRGPSVTALRANQDNWIACNSSAVAWATLKFRPPFSASTFINSIPFINCVYISNSPCGNNLARCYRIQAYFAWYFCKKEKVH